MSSYILSYASCATGTHGRGGGKCLVGPLDFFMCLFSWKSIFHIILYMVFHCDKCLQPLLCITITYLIRFAIFSFFVIYVYE